MRILTPYHLVKIFRLWVFLRPVSWQQQIIWEHVAVAVNTSMFQNPLPAFDVPTYSIHVDRGAHVTYHDQALTNALCFEASQTSINLQDICYPWHKVLGSHPVFPPFFNFTFIKKKTFKLPSGTDHLVEPRVCFTSMSGLLWCLVTLFPWLRLFVSSMCLRQVFLGRLRDWVPICWLVTQGSCITNLHLLSSVAGLTHPKTKHTIFTWHLS